MGYMGILRLLHLLHVLDVLHDVLHINTPFVKSNYECFLLALRPRFLPRGSMMTRRREKSRGKQIRIQKTQLLLWIFLLVFLVEWIADIIETWMTSPWSSCSSSWWFPTHILGRFVPPKMQQCEVGESWGCGSFNEFSEALHIRLVVPEWTRI